MADETTFQVMKEPGRKNTSKSYMWLFRSELDGRPILFYQYHPTRSGKVATDFLANYQGTLISDGYAGYNEVGSRAEITHAGCWAHARRKFKEADDVTSTKNTQRALSLIQSLYLVEKKIREEEMGLDKILALRQKKSKPIDNNRIENDIRPFVLGRKNWLLSGGPRGAHASCALYSLIQMARAQWS